MGWQFYDRNGALKQAAAGAVNPMARVMAGAAQSIPNNTFTPLTFVTPAAYDTDAMWAVGTPTRLTIKTAGKYLLEGTVMLGGSAGGVLRQFQFLLNGVVLPNGKQNAFPNGTNSHRITTSTVMSLSVGDYIEAAIYQDSGGALNTLYSAGVDACELSVTKIDGVVYVPSKPPRITTSPLSGGPPASPDDGDIWIATGVDATGSRWQFQYDAAESTAYKWKFIGGPPAFILNGGGIANTVANVFQERVTATRIVVARAGTYIAEAGGMVSQGVANTRADLGPGTVSSGAAMVANAAAGMNAGSLAVLTGSAITTVAAGETFNVMMRTGDATPGNCVWYDIQLRVTPVKVA
jgi:hypothetical protein